MGATSSAAPVQALVDTALQPSWVDLRSFPSFTGQLLYARRRRHRRGNKRCRVAAVRGSSAKTASHAVRCPLPPVSKAHRPSLSCQA